MARSGFPIVTFVLSHDDHCGWGGGVQGGRLLVWLWAVLMHGCWGATAKASVLRRGRGVIVPQTDQYATDSVEASIAKLR